MYKEGMFNGNLMYRDLWPRVTTKHAWVQFPSSVITDKLYNYKVWDCNSKDPMFNITIVPTPAVPTKS